MTAGTVLLRAAAHAGYYGLMTQLFGPQVRGGEAAALVQIATEPIEAPARSLRPVRGARLGQGRAVQRRNPARRAPRHHRRSGSRRGAAGHRQVEGACGGAGDERSERDRLERGLRGRRTNMFAAGVGRARSSASTQRHLQAAIDDVLRRQGRGDSSPRTATGAACRQRKRPPALTLNLRLDPPQPAARWLISGNQALALGALRGGVRFVGCYPITPATDLVEWLAPANLQARRPAGAGRGRTRCHQHDARRLLRRHAGHDGDLRSRLLVDGRDARARGRGRDPGGDRST